LFHIAAEKEKTMTDYAPARMTFKTIPGDPIHVKHHTLSNGLQLFMSVNPDEPRVYTEIAVRVGSKHDPADTTGLAHYFEHMMFKGTDRLGSLNWAAEKPLLDQIEALFEEHRSEKDPERKKKLYAEIDRISFEAAKFAAANEYDKLVSAIGAKGTNAYTWVEQTVYVNDVPANELDRWFQLESERFRRPILRLFHTELETVFEEYNINQDRDFRKVLKAMQAMLTPTHPYGTQTTLGRGEDLKNPSQTNIYRFFDSYYVPNNMAIILCGDFDPEQAVVLAERHFGSFVSKPIPPFHVEKQPEIEAREQQDVYGNEAAWMELGWRFPGASSEEVLMLPLIAGILHNYQAGLFDLNLLQKQKMLEAYAYPRVYEDYSSLIVYGKPREGQTLEQVEQLLLGELENLRNGHFEDWLPGAVVKDIKLSEAKELEKNQGRAALITTAFVAGVPWNDVVHRWLKLEKITKQDVVDFARRHFNPTKCLVVYKHCAEDQAVLKVEKPPITAVELNRIGRSAFAESFLDHHVEDITPEFVDFKKTIHNASISKVLKLRSVKHESDMFRLYYIYDMGKTSDRRLPLAAGYLTYLGTSQYSANEMQQALYRLGLHFTATCQDEHFYLTLTGLNESFEEGVRLMEHLLHDAQPNAEALKNLVADVLVRRDNDKKDKRTVLNKALFNYAKYGPVSPFSDKFSKEALMNLTPEELTERILNLSKYRHDVFYSGKRGARSVAAVLKQHHPSNEKLLAPQPAKHYPEKGVRSNRVLFVHFPMVQVELMLLSKGTPKFNLEEYAMAEWYNQYFGYGLSSIVFQDIRESKALAYSAYAFASSPNQKKRSHFLQAYVGTQPDKLREAVQAFQTILEDMPVSASQIETARQSIRKQIAASRLRKSDLYWTWRANREKGFPNHDLRLDVYNMMDKATTEHLLDYQIKQIKGRHYTWLVMGDRSQIDFKYLKTIGPLKELTMEQIFGY